MARNRKRERGSQYGLARPNPLDHTASRSRDPFDFDAGDAPDFGGFYPSTVRPLIRTVLEISSPYQPTPRRGKRQSPNLPVRATFRSRPNATRSHFGQATLVTPQLTERALECAQRSIRREVLFATKRTSKGSGSPRKPRSKVKC